jgi:hypothetical protein
MASLNLSTNGPSISKSYQSVVNAPPPSGSAASSPTYGQWAVFTVSAPLVNAFQQDSGNKESVLKVQSTGGRRISKSYSTCTSDCLQRENWLILLTSSQMVAHNLDTSKSKTQILVCPRTLSWHGAAKEYPSGRKATSEVI